MIRLGRLLDQEEIDKAYPSLDTFYVHTVAVDVQRPRSWSPGSFCPLSISVLCIGSRSPPPKERKGCWIMSGRQGVIPLRGRGLP